MVYVFMLLLCVLSVVSEKITFVDVKITLSSKKQQDLSEQIVITTKNLPSSIKNYNIDTYDAIKIEHQVLPIVYENAFQYLNTSHLAIVETDLKEFEPGAFNDLKKLETLTVGANLLKSIRKGIFNNLPITKLYLDDNKIKVIEGGSFDGMQRLTHIVLSMNKIIVLEKGLFKDLAELVSIRLDFNKIERIEELAFQNLPNLHRLDLDNNKIKILQASSLVNLPTLTVLLLQVNELESISLKNLDSLVVLWLYENKLKTLDMHMLNDLKSVKKINATNNEIGVLNCKSSTGFNVQFFDFSYNKIKNISEDCFNGSKIEHLKLSNNKIQNIPAESFRSANIKELHLQNNLITEIKKGTFANLHMSQLLLENNQIVDIEAGAFENSTFQSINLDGNKLRSIRHGVFDNTKVAFISILRNDGINERAFNNVSNLWDSKSGTNKLEFRRTTDKVLADEPF
ncbi:leucine-rich repeat-containing protein 15 [Diabrotica virgifera virgifera]|uniref:Leucine-rich repeat-containing protein 15-like n=1 Tax=Diabrotica virgifera virgifera TaxID=50390 RepID=A0A6P7H102_DIAVI|nr:leucine-rich repeat-containing protein 15 [Diabrotica virgifera virgifera]